MFLSREVKLNLCRILAQTVRSHIFSDNIEIGYKFPNPEMRKLFTSCIDNVIRKRGLQTIMDNNLNYYSEQISKRAIREKVGRCGELTETILSLLKMTPLKVNEDLYCSLMLFRKHSFLILHNEIVFNFLQNLPEDSYGLIAHNFSELNTLLSLFDQNAILCDPWICKAVYIENWQEIITTATSYRVENIYTGSIYWGGTAIPILKPGYCHNNFTKKHSEKYPNMLIFKMLQETFYNNLRNEGYDFLIPLSTHSASTFICRNYNIHHDIFDG